MNDRFKFRIIIEKDCKTVNGTFKGQYVYYCNGFCQGKTKTYFWGNGKKYTFLNSQIKEIHQCTGLKDKNGKLIYEGDILEGNKTIEKSPINSQIVLKRGLVKIPDGMFVATCQDMKENCTLFTQVNWNKTEIIGNIYENPELLDK